MTTRIFGYIGLGAMGGPIAERLVKGGIELVGYDVEDEKREHFSALGGRAAESIEELAASCDAIFACLPSVPICREVAEKVANAPSRRATIYAEMSTIGVAPMREIAEMFGSRGMQTVDAPVSGGPASVPLGRLTCFAAGPLEAVDFLEPAHAVLTGNLFRLGNEPGAAQMMKLGNNLLAATNLAAASEIVRLLERFGIDPAIAIDAINVSTGRNRATEVVIPQQILTGKYHQDAKLHILAKDTDAAVSAAREMGCDIAIGQAVRDVWNEANTGGMGDGDITRIFDWIGRKL